MGQVTVTINGRQYRMACEDGQEQHLIGLAADVEGRIGQLRGAFGEIGDQRLTVMVAIMVADELQEAARKVAQLQEQLAATREAESVAQARIADTERAAADTLLAAAQRMERLAQSLSGTRDTPGLGLG